MKDLSEREPETDTDRRIAELEDGMRSLVGLMAQMLEAHNRVAADVAAVKDSLLAAAIDQAVAKIEARIKGEMH